MNIKQKQTNKIKKNLLLNILEWWFSNLLIARGIALIAVLNLGLVLFDVTYIALRDFWLLGKVTVAKFQLGKYEYDGVTFKILPNKITNLVTKYDVIKSIVPFRDTDNYLKKVNLLEETIKNNGLYSVETEKILANLRKSSLDMITQDSFKLANKTGTLEKIKNLMRDHIPNKNNSSKEAFNTFWSVDYLANKTQQELDYFKQEIKPLIATNYFRPYSETGGFIDYFGIIDFPFFVIISIDFLGRTLYISLRYTGVNWFEAMLWRWYDLIFFLPTFRWLRIIPVIIRLDETKLIDLKAVKKQSSQGFVASIAGDITEVVILRIIDQIQGLITEGAIKKIIPSSENNQEYIDLNDTNEIAEITKLVIQLIVYQVLPEIRPDVENLLKYTIEKAIIESPAYQNIKNFPPLANLPKNISNKISPQIYQITLDTIHNILKEDPVFELYLKKIIEKLTKTISSEITAKESIDKVEYLFNSFLEEFKVNYIQKLSQEDVEKLLEETRFLKIQSKLD